MGFQSVVWYSDQQQHIPENDVVIRTLRPNYQEVMWCYEK